MAHWTYLLYLLTYNRPELRQEAFHLLGMELGRRGGIGWGRGVLSDPAAEDGSRHGLSQGRFGGGPWRHCCHPAEPSAVCIRLSRLSSRVPPLQC
jgi:hypothetical protein